MCTGFGWIWTCAVWSQWLTTLATAWHKSKVEYSKPVSILGCQYYCILLEKGHEVLVLKQSNAWPAGPRVHPFLYCSSWPLDIKLDLVVWWEYICTWVIYICNYWIGLACWEITLDVVWGPSSRWRDVNCKFHALDAHYSQG
jgi:hypothetical protein